MTASQPVSAMAFDLQAPFNVTSYAAHQSIDRLSSTSFAPALSSKAVVRDARPARKAAAGAAQGRSQIVVTVQGEGCTVFDVSSPLRTPPSEAS